MGNFINPASGHTEFAFKILEPLNFNSCCSKYLLLPSNLYVSFTLEFLFKWTTPASFSFIFVFFKRTLQFLHQLNVKKCPSSIRCHDSNSQPSDYESPPLTTRPGLPPFILEFLLKTVASIAQGIHMHLTPFFSCSLEPVK